MVFFLVYISVCGRIGSVSLNIFFNYTATTEIYTYSHTLSLHDALPICREAVEGVVGQERSRGRRSRRDDRKVAGAGAGRDEARPEIGRAPSELQSLMRSSYAVFCLKKKKVLTYTI